MRSNAVPGSGGRGIQLVTVTLITSVHVAHRGFTWHLIPPTSKSQCLRSQIGYFQKMPEAPAYYPRTKSSPPAGLNA